MRQSFIKYILASLSIVTTTSVALAQTYNEPFTGNSLPSGFQVVAASGITPSLLYTASGVVFNNSGDGDRAFLKTNFRDFASIDFTASLTVQIPNNVFFFGIGKGSSITYPEPSDVIGTRSHSATPTWGSQNGFRDGNTAFGLGSANFSDYPSNFVLQWTASTKSALFTIYDYNTGGSLVNTYTTTIDGSNNGYTANDSYLYFGGAQGIKVSNFVVTTTSVPEASTYAMYAVVGIITTVIAIRSRREAR